VSAVNLWVDPEHALRYLAERDTLPHRSEGRAVLMELVAGPRATRVLDLGTGDGDTLALVLSAHPHATGVGVDFQPEMLHRARVRFARDAVEIVAHDLDQPLPASLGRFDLVVSSFALHHLVPARQRAIYAEVFALLEPGGRFANLEHVQSPTATLHVDFLAALGRAPDDDDPSNQLVAPDELLQYLRDAGFDDVECFWKWRELALLSGVKAHASIGTNNS
jgi:tRNA (cmo5U34)-methyltransferase